MPSTIQWPPIDPGTRVITTQLDKQACSSYDSSSLAEKRWGVTGTVKTHSDGDGLCYHVEHDIDHTEGWYEPSEIKILEDQIEEIIM